MTRSTSLVRSAFAAFILGSAASAQAQTQAPQTPQTTSPGAAAPAAGGDAATIDAAFKQADTNADGKLSSDELSQYPALAPRFPDLDKDKDGFVSSVEFSSAVTVKGN